MSIAGTPPAFVDTTGSPLANASRIEDGHVVDLRCLDVDVGVRVVLPDVGRIDAARKRHAAQPELGHEAPERGLSRAAADEGQRRVRISALDHAKARTVQATLYRASKLRVESNRGRNGSRSRKRNRSRSMMFGTISAGIPCSAKTLCRKREGTTFSIDRSQRESGDRRTAEMIRRLAAPIVHEDGPAEEAGNNYRRQRREQERPVRRRKNVHDIGPSQFPHQHRQIDELVDDRPHVLDSSERTQPSRRFGIDRHQKRRNVGVCRPRIEQASSLHCLTAEDGERRRDKGDREFGARRELSSACVSDSKCKGRARHLQLDRCDFCAIKNTFM